MSRMALVVPATLHAVRRAWRVFSFISLNDFMAARGYSLFLGLMYVMAVGVVINVALCTWVGLAFASGKFDHVW